MATTVLVNLEWNGHKKLFLLVYAEGSVSPECVFSEARTSCHGTCGLFKVQQYDLQIA